MKRLMPTIVLALILTACGGGGGGGNSGSVTLPTASKATKGTGKLYLFGTMSSNSRIATVQTTFVVPMGVMVNYSSPSGASQGVFPLRGGAIVPSGTVQVAASNVSGSYDTGSRRLVVSILNQPGANQVDLKSSTTGIGEEIATLRYNLETPGVEIPIAASNVTVWQARSVTTVDYLNGCLINVNTTFN